VGEVPVLVPPEQRSGGVGDTHHHYAPLSKTASDGLQSGEHIISIQVLQEVERRYHIPRFGVRLQVVGCGTVTHIVASEAASVRYLLVADVHAEGVPKTSLPQEC